VKARHSSELRSSYVQFNETQVLFRTDVEEVADYVARSHKAMIVPTGDRVVGRVEVLHSDRGYIFQGTDRLDFAGEARLLFDLLTRDILAQFMRAHADLLWLHAGVVEDQQRAVIIVGPSAQGKSTLATRLIELGWGYLSDEMAPIRMTTDEVLPYARTPVRRLNPGRSVAAHESTELEREAFELTPKQVRHSATTIGLIIFPRFSYGSSTALTMVTPGEASIELICNCMNFPEHRAAAVAKVAGLCASIPGYRLDYGNGREAASLLHQRASTGVRAG
jgi:hypothetical protein